MKKKVLRTRALAEEKEYFLQDILFFILHFFNFFIRGDPYLKAPNAD